MNQQTIDKLYEELDRIATLREDGRIESDEYYTRWLELNQELREALKAGAIS